MNLQWEKRGRTWFLRNKDINEADGETTYAIVECYGGEFHVNWWTTLDHKENKKKCIFEGTLDEMKAYVLALVRLGATE